MAFELKVLESIPGKLAINYEELKKELDVRLQQFKGIVFTEEQIAVAKQTRADLNRVAKVIDERRKELKKEYLKPYEEVETQAKELVGMISAVNSEIDKQIKAFEEREKEEKKIKIAQLWCGLKYNKITVDKIWNDKWLNKTFSMKDIEEEMRTRITEIEADLNAIDELCQDEEKAKILKSKYLISLDLTKVITDYNSEQKARELLEQEEKKLVDTEGIIEAEVIEEKHEEPKTEPVYEINFKVYGTERKIKELSQFLKENGYKYERI